jgi:hypothetical protein
MPTRFSASAIAARLTGPIFRPARRSDSRLRAAASAGAGVRRATGRDRRSAKACAAARSRPAGRQGGRWPARRIPPGCRNRSHRSCGRPGSPARSARQAATALPDPRRKAASRRRAPRRAWPTRKARPCSCARSAPCNRPAPSLRSSMGRPAASRPCAGNSRSSPAHRRSSRRGRAGRRRRSRPRGADRSMDELRLAEGARPGAVELVQLQVAAVHQFQGRDQLAAPKILRLPPSQVRVASACGR